MIPPPISLPGARQYGALLLNDGKTIYFSSDREGGYGDLDNYYSERKGDQWGEPVNFGPQINTPDQDADMAVSKDGNVIIFPSKRSDSINGSTDLYITRKVNNGCLSKEERAVSSQVFVSHFRDGKWLEACRAPASMGRCLRTSDLASTRLKPTPAHG